MLGLVCLAVVCGACGGPAPGPERLVVIVIDTLRRDHLSVYGAKQTTPHIDALAARGQAVPNMLSAFHQTSMSMASLFTGRTPSLERTGSGEALPWNSSTWCGMVRLGDEGAGCIPEGLSTLAERVRDVGYWTIGIPSNEFLYEPSGFSQGFDDWVEVGRKSKDREQLAQLKLRGEVRSRTWQHVHRAVVRALDRRPHDHFFLYVHYMDVHDYRARGYVYARGVALVDAAVGRLLEELDRRGLLEDAVVILTADHGERLGEVHAVEGSSSHFGNPSFQELLEVPLVVAPARIGDAQPFLRTQDLFTTILEIAGAGAERSDEPARDELFVSEHQYRTYLHGGWKSSIRREDGSQQLYDLVHDPDESRNLTEEHPQIAEEQRRRIEDLASRLGARPPALRDLSSDDRERLRALGYLDEEP